MGSSSDSSSDGAISTQHDSGSQSSGTNVGSHEMESSRRVQQNCLEALEEKSVTEDKPDRPEFHSDNCNSEVGENQKKNECHEHSSDEQTAVNASSDMLADTAINQTTVIVESEDCDVENIYQGENFPSGESINAVENDVSGTTSDNDDDSGHAIMEKQRKEDDDSENGVDDKTQKDKDEQHQDSNDVEDNDELMIRSYPVKEDASDDEDYMMGSTPPGHIEEEEEDDDDYMIESTPAAQFEDDDYNDYVIGMTPQAQIEDDDEDDYDIRPTPQVKDDDDECVGSVPMIRMLVEAEVSAQTSDKGVNHDSGKIVSVKQGNDYVPDPQSTNAKASLENLAKSCRRPEDSTCDQHPDLDYEEGDQDQQVELSQTSQEPAATPEVQSTVAASASSNLSEAALAAIAAAQREAEVMLYQQRYPEQTGDSSKKPPKEKKAKKKKSGKYHGEKKKKKKKETGQD
jgi:hypothetical protein